MFVQKDKDYSNKLRFGSVTEFDIFIIDNDKSGDKIIDEWIDIIKDGYKTTEDIETFRTWGFLDHLRAKEYPDDILVGFFKEGFGGEGMYVKLIKKENDKIFGKLLSGIRSSFK